MKYTREIKIGVLAAVSIFLLIFGFNYLKGINIFSSVFNYHGRFVKLHGLQKQSPVFIRGYKVGLVNDIHYDFTQDSAFVVDISIDKSIQLPYGTQMALFANGLIDGTAIELVIPTGSISQTYALGDFIPTTYVPGLMDKIQNELLATIDSLATNANDLICSVKNQLADNNLKSSLQNINTISYELKTASKQLNSLMNNKIPTIVDKMDTALYNVNDIIADVKKADLKTSISKLNVTIDKANKLITKAQSPEGTIGLLLHDDKLYNNINTAVLSVDSLLVDLKANPKRYVHFSLFGKKDKEKNKKKK